MEHVQFEDAKQGDVLLTFNADDAPKDEEDDFNPAEMTAKVADLPPASQTRAIERMEEVIKSPEMIHTLHDTGNARRLADWFGDGLMHVTGHGWYAYRGGAWKIDPGKKCVREKAKKMGPKMYREAITELAHRDEDSFKKVIKFSNGSQNAGKISAMISMAESDPQISVDIDDLNKDKMLFNCANGTIDLETGKLKRHDPAQRITRISPTRYYPEATCPKWEEFLDTIFAGDKDLIDFMQRAVGYSLTGQTSEQVLIILWGSGANGKSTMLETLKHIFSGYAKTANMSALLVGDQDKNVRHELADLYGARLALAAETNANRRLNEGVIKQLTGGDTIKAEHKYQNPFEYCPEYTLMLATNHKPKIAGTDHGIWRRLKLVPFGVTIADHEQDKNLTQKLIAEAEGILAWCVNGCLAWQERGLLPADAVLAATDEYREEENVVTRFISDRCKQEFGAKVKASVLYGDFKDWLEDQGERNVSNQNFARKMVELGYEKRRNEKGVIYKGISLPEDQQ